MATFPSLHYGGETSYESVLRWLVGIRPHVYQGFPPLWLFNYSLHTCRPLLIIPRRVKWLDSSVGTIEVELFRVRANVRNKNSFN